MRHLDLFSGIGGFALAASRVWGDEHEIVAFCEIDVFCQKVLRKNFPNVYIHDNIKTLTGFDFRGIDLLTAGFPCQPYSHAGQRKGAADDRALWYEALRVIQETRPTWVLAENVTGIVSMELDRVCTSLEDSGYAVETYNIPACAVNAPHRRERIWIIAYAARKQYQQRATNQALSIRTLRQAEHELESGNLTSSKSTTPNTDSAPTEHTIQTGRDFAPIASAKGLTSNASGIRRRKRDVGQPGQSLPSIGWSLTEPPLCGRTHGIPNRVDRVRALGNAIVPQVAEEIFQHIRFQKSEGITLRLDYQTA